MRNTEPDHYAILGLDRKCTEDQIRAAYRILAKRFHPDVNQGSADAMERTQAINAAYETLSDPEKRSAYDQDRESRKAEKSKSPNRSGKADRNINQDVHLKIEEFLRGTTLDVKVNDPGNPEGPESYELIVPPETAPGSRFKVPRDGGGFVIVRAKAQPGFRFKVRGSDLRCDLKITAKRAAQGGSEILAGANGTMVRVPIPAGIARGETIRISGEGMPKPRGNRGDLLVRIMYRPEVKITRAGRR
ncbi:MAG TPA: DnaJ domain-containing protein [Verrucomicrobiae bacterium]